MGEIKRLPRVNNEKWPHATNREATYCAYHWRDSNPRPMTSSEHCSIRLATAARRTKIRFDYKYKISIEISCGYI